MTLKSLFLKALFEIKLQHFHDDFLILTNWLGTEAIKRAPLYGQSGDKNHSRIDLNRIQEHKHNYLALNHHNAKHSALRGVSQSQIIIILALRFQLFGKCTICLWYYKSKVFVIFRRYAGRNDVAYYFGCGWIFANFGSDDSCGVNLLLMCHCLSGRVYRARSG